MKFPSITVHLEHAIRKDKGNQEGAFSNLWWWLLFIEQKHDYLHENPVLRLLTQNRKTTYCMEWSPSVDQFSASQEIPHILWNPRFITALTSAHNLFLTWARTIQSMHAHSISWRYILMLYSHLPLVFPSGIYPSGFPTKTLYAPHLVTPAYVLHAQPIHSSRLITWIIFGEEYRSLSSSLCNFLHSPVTPSLLCPNILLNTLFSNTISLCSSLNVSDQVSHPYKTTGKIIVLYILSFKFLDSKLEDKRFCTEW